MNPGGGLVARTLAELERLDVASLPVRPEPGRVLMCPPDFFDVVDVKNAFMEGNRGTVDRQAARREWEDLRATFVGCGRPVVTIDAVEGLEDMVFAANQSLPGIDREGNPYVVLGRMRHDSRRREVPYYRAWFEREGYRVVELPPDVERFEGQGDALWHPGRELLWGGCGQRTCEAAYDAISRALEVPVVLLELVDPRFYHLDTCLCMLSAEAALVFPAAFTDEGRRTIGRLFERVIEVDEEEAAGLFACNAYAPGGGAVVLQRGAERTVAKLREAGFDPVEVETREFIKSGGSVFCMKATVY